MRWPLEGVHVVDMTQNVAGPYAGMILAEMGATVIKVEPPEGDPTRSWGPPFWEGHSASYLALNRNKQGVVINIKSEEGIASLHELLEKTDVFLISTRPGVSKRHGLDYETLHEKYPKLVYGEVTAYGHYGPKQKEPGYDPLMQAMGGIMSVTGRPGEEPVRVGTSIIDMGTGMWLALGVMGALQMRSQNGTGHRVVSALFETSVAWMTYHATSFWASGKSPQGWGSGTSTIVPYEAFPTKNDEWIIIAAGNDNLFRSLCHVLERPDWIDDERYATNAQRVNHRQELIREIRNITRTATSVDWLEKLRHAGIPASPVANVGQVMMNPQLLAGDLVQTIDHPDIPEFRSIGMPIMIDDCRPPLNIYPPGRLDALQHNGAAHKQV